MTGLDDDLPDPWAEPRDVEQAATPEPVALGPWVWAAMEPDQRRERLVELDGWVSWLVDTFELQSHLPQCWWRHPALIEHLTALYAGWVRTYTGEPDGRLAEAEWLDALHRLLPHLAVNACASTHVEAPRRTWASRGLEEELGLSGFGTLPAQHPAAAARARYLALLGQLAQQSAPGRG